MVHSSTAFDNAKMDVSIALKSPLLTKGTMTLIKTYLMKTIHKMTYLLLLLFCVCCSEIPENNDPILGIWAIESKTPDALGQTSRIRREWIFNDAYLGRYHYYENNEILIRNDYRWSSEEGWYTVEYVGNDLPNDVFSISTSEEHMLMINRDNQIIGFKE